jgi:transposase
VPSKLSRSIKANNVRVGLLAIREFGFFKDPLFFTSSVFLKSPEQIMALAMIMVLCLLVYNLEQRQLR